MAKTKQKPKWTQSICIGGVNINVFHIYLPFVWLISIRAHLSLSLSESESDAIGRHIVFEQMAWAR